jgi:uncharacterized protein YbaP (TraB family)
MTSPLLQKLRKHAVRLLALLLALVTCVSQAQTGAKAGNSRRFLLWKVTSPTTKVYLLGSIHMGTPDFYPLPQGMESAFAASKVLAVEVNIKNIDSAGALGLTQERGLYGEGDTLSRHLSKQTSDALDQFCSKSGVPRELFEPFKPWLAAMTVTVLGMQQAGDDQKLGIDMHFLDEVKPLQRIDELETADFQMSVLSSGTEQEQQEFLAATLKQMANAKESMQKMNQAFVAGDEGKIEQMMEEESEPKSFFKRLVEDRNVDMAARVENYLKGTEQCFVVVGVGHLVGPKGIVKLLEAKNYRVDRVTP